MLLFFLGWQFEIVDVILIFRERGVCSVKYEVCCVVLRWFLCEIFVREMWFEKKKKKNFGFYDLKAE